ncbi:MAG: hypothetical protein M3Q81_00295 [bacterium]|nr:hypothetical protein [bacterium]
MKRMLRNISAIFVVLVVLFLLIEVTAPLLLTGKYPVTLIQLIESRVTQTRVLESFRRYSAIDNPEEAGYVYSTGFEQYVPKSVLDVEYASPVDFTQPGDYIFYDNEDAYNGVHLNHTVVIAPDGSEGIFNIPVLYNNWDVTPDCSAMVSTQHDPEEGSYLLVSRLLDGTHERIFTDGNTLEERRTYGRSRFVDPWYFWYQVFISPDGGQVAIEFLDDGMYGIFIQTIGPGNPERPQQKDISDRVGVRLERRSEINNLRWSQLDYTRLSYSMGVDAHWGGTVVNDLPVDTEHVMTDAERAEFEEPVREPRNGWPAHLVNPYVSHSRGKFCTVVGESES